MKRLERRTHGATAVQYTLAMAILWSLTAATVPAQAPGWRGDEADRGRSWAILVGVEDYQNIAPLRFALNDVEQLALALRERGGLREDAVVRLVETAPEPRFRPLCDSVQAQLHQSLAQAEPDDQVLVYFRVHGYRDTQGRLYLAPIDFDPRNPVATGLAFEWLREELGACKARQKLLILDARHADSESETAAIADVGEQDPGTPFDDLPGVITLASSASGEESQLWDDKRQSLFSYWLVQGLKGHADANGDAAVAFDELYDYVRSKVTYAARRIFPRAQTPVRVVGSDTSDTSPVVRLRPQSLKQVLTDIAEQLADAIRIAGIDKVGVLEFSNETRQGELLGADFGLLGRYCAEELEERLMRQATGSFQVVDRRRMQAALEDQGFGVKDVVRAGPLERLAHDVGGMPVIAQGTLRNRRGRVVTVQCKLLRTNSDELAGRAGGTAVLDESEWAMIGRSAAVHPEEDRRPLLPTADAPVAAAENEVAIERLDTRAQGPHPLLSPRFPYRVRILVDGKERLGAFHGNDLYVPLRRGEVYEIAMENRTDAPVFLRLLVDGLNTLPERAETKGMAVEAAMLHPVYLPARRVNLGDARAWLLDPQVSRTSTVRGFFARTGSDAVYHQFKVVDRMDSLAARERYTDQLGMITAAFYAPRGDSRGLGTGFGDEVSAETGTYDGPVPGDLLAVVHIRYVEPEAIEASKAGAGASDRQ